jgi:hypothetical protein
MEQNGKEHSTIIVTREQLDKIRPYMPDVDNMLNFSLHEFLCNLDDAIVFQLDDEYNSTKTSRMLQNVYDEIYDQNKK